MTTLFCGLKRLEAERDQSGGARESGKRPFMYSRYYSAMEPNVPIKVRRNHSNIALGVC
ncbi:hypothetical protein PPTG_24264 [Phytophthora nicotianae INRA-310]|uniref:Uncharacterized protein n=1 Tax=Phytophthora nicotianae (strain INRA-310) TaxID=761204 RepID=W2PHS7_PHYN3|nr:hypothetical protein PPTG_24264 [Phytophthora nicotianae INRA-310]ETN00412.1 hypothetical protein PPTG_24264 [Phytophthora nicotianae INRA-310]